MGRGVQSRTLPGPARLDLTEEHPWTFMPFVRFSRYLLHSFVIYHLRRVFSPLFFLLPTIFPSTLSLSFGFAAL